MDKADRLTSANDQSKNKAPAAEIDIKALYEAKKDSVVQVNDGSGFFIASQPEAGRCDLVTSKTIVGDKVSAQVKLADGTTYTGSVDSVMPDKNLAIISIESVKNPAATCKALTLSERQVTAGEKLVQLSADGGNRTYRWGKAGAVIPLNQAISDVASYPGETPARPIVVFDTAGKRADIGGPVLDTSGKVVAVTDKQGYPTSKPQFLTPTEGIPSAYSWLGNYRNVKDSTVQVNSNGTGFFVSPSKPTSGVCEVATTAIAAGSQPVVDITLPNGTKFKAEVAKLDVKEDLAILRMQGVPDSARVCKSLPLASSEPTLNDQVLGVGWASGKQYFQTGTVSGISRFSESISNAKDFPQEDANRQVLSITPSVRKQDGNWLYVNGHGQVTGLSSKFSTTDSKQFATPSAALQADLTELRSFDPMNFAKERLNSLVRVHRFEQSGWFTSATETAAGSGFFVAHEKLPKNSCLVVTNNHVPGPSDTLKIELRDGRKFDSTIVGRDQKNDLAFVRIDNVDNPSEACPSLPLAGSEQPVKAGDPIVQLSSRDAFWFRSGRAVKYDK